MLGPLGQATQSHAGLLRSPPALPAVAVDAAGDDVRPLRLAALRARGDVVVRQLAGLAGAHAVLAGVLVAGEEVAAGEADLRPFSPDEAEQAHHGRHPDAEGD